MQFCFEALRYQLERSLCSPGGRPRSFSCRRSGVVAEASGTDGGSWVREGRREMSVWLLVHRRAAGALVRAAAPRVGRRAGPGQKLVRHGKVHRPVGEEPRRPRRPRRERPPRARRRVCRCRGTASGARGGWSGREEGSVRSELPAALEVDCAALARDEARRRVPLQAASRGQGAPAGRSHRSNAASALGVSTPGGGGGGGGGGSLRVLTSTG